MIRPAVAVAVAVVMAVAAGGLAATAVLAHVGPASSAPESCIEPETDYRAEDEVVYPGTPAPDTPASCHAPSRPVNDRG